MKRQAESQHVAGAQEQQLLASIVVSGLHSPSLIDPKWQQNATNVKIGHPHAFAARASGHRPDSFDSIIRVAEEQGRAQATHHLLLPAADGPCDPDPEHRARHENCGACLVGSLGFGLTTPIRQVKFQVQYQAIFRQHAYVENTDANLYLSQTVEAFAMHCGARATRSDRLLCGCNHICWGLPLCQADRMRGPSRA